MTKLLSFIKTSNQVLLFIAALLFIVMISKEILSDLFSKPYEPPKVELVDDQNSKSDKKKQVYAFNYLAKLKDVHIFDLSSKVIDTSKSHENSSFEMFSYVKSSQSAYLSDNAVNLMFVKEDGHQRMLLKNDGLVTEFTKARVVTNENTLKLDKNVYLIVSEDTNKNGFFDQKDSAKLYTSSYDGNNLSLVLENVESFRLIDDNSLMILQKGDVTNFYKLNIDDSSLNKLNTSINQTSN